MTTTPAVTAATISLSVAQRRCLELQRALARAARRHGGRDGREHPRDGVRRQELRGGRRGARVRRDAQRFDLLDDRLPPFPRRHRLALGSHDQHDRATVRDTHTRRPRSRLPLLLSTTLFIFFRRPPKRVVVLADATQADNGYGGRSGSVTDKKRRRRPARSTPATRDARRSLAGPVDQQSQSHFPLPLRSAGTTSSTTSTRSTTSSVAAPGPQWKSRAMIPGGARPRRRRRRRRAARRRRRRTRRRRRMRRCASS